VTSYDNAYAIEQIEQGHYSILNRAPNLDADVASPYTKSGKTVPRVITLGGDHTITREPIKEYLNSTVF
jgi:agmatinase